MFDFNIWQRKYFWQLGTLPPTMALIKMLHFKGKQSKLENRLGCL